MAQCARPGEEGLARARRQRAVHRLRRRRPRRGGRRRAASCKFRNSGQTCISANRILVQAPVYDEFVQRLVDGASALKVGSGLEPDTRIGPLIEQQAIDKVERHVADALDRGGELLIGGEHLGGLFYSRR